MNKNKDIRLGCGFVLAAPHSGSGKTTLSIGLMRALKRRGIDVAPAKIGPDYIDPQFHEVACGTPSFNLDGWAMGGDMLNTLGAAMSSSSSLLVVEGVMGLFDGAVKPGVLGHGATCDIAKFFKLPVILVVDCAGMGQSVAALVKGFAEYDPDVHIAGVILNKLGSLRHVEMMERALDKIGMAVVGAIPRYEDMVLPSRHLGLVQATENSDIEQQIDRIADHVEAHISIDKICDLARPMMLASSEDGGGMAMPEFSSPVFSSQSSDSPGLSSLSNVSPELLSLSNASLEFLSLSNASPDQYIAIAQDDAFRFFYPHIRKSWLDAGVTLSFFSPLKDEAPDEGADAIYLPGGYPELYAEQLSGCDDFMTGLRRAAAEGTVIYGECGGYMVLGEGLVDRDNQHHKMAGLLPLETSFAKRKLHLGYRHVKRADGRIFRGHEFHYASVITERGEALFRDVDGTESYGLLDGSVSGSFVHLIDVA